MKAIQLTGFGGVENLELTELDRPEVGAGQVLIESKAISINPVDVKTRLGKGVAAQLKDHLPALIGWDISGTILEVGTGVDTFTAGQEVFGMIAFPSSGKTYAEFVVANASELTIKPRIVSHEEAAAASLAALTAWQALTVHGRFQPNDRLLIHAASGGVGHYAIQIAKYFGAHVIATSSAANKSFVKSLGADEHIDYHNQQFDGMLSEVDFVLDCMGGEYIDRSIKIMKKGGTIISLPTGLNESVSEKAAAAGMTGKAIRVHPDGNHMKAIAELMAERILRSHIDKRYDFENMAAAHAHVESGRTAGKVVLSF
jgi:NADPH:quinone reductase-like Zn-dependent oxidoreductase